MVSDVIDSNANGRNNFFCAEAPKLLLSDFWSLKRMWIQFMWTRFDINLHGNRQARELKH